MVRNKRRMFWIHGVCLVIIITAHWHSPECM